MEADRLWTAAELEGLSPNERRDLLNQRVVTDLSLVPIDVLERARSTGKALMEAHRRTHTAQ